MTLLAENENDIGEIALARPGDHIGRARAVAAHAHVERSVEAEGEAALGLIELHGRDAEVEHHPVGFREAGIVRGVIEIGKPLLDQREAAIGALHQIRAGRDRALIAIDADNFAIGGGEDGARIAAGAEGGVDIDAAVMHVEHGKRRGAQHRNMAGCPACDSRNSCRRPRSFRCSAYGVRGQVGVARMGQGRKGCRSGPEHGAIRHPC